MNQKTDINIIYKNKIKGQGYGLIGSSKTLTDEKQRKTEKIKAILPALVNSDGLLDVSSLKDFLGIENLVSSSQNYSLNFAGKGLAKIKADESTHKELKIEPKQSKDFDKTENVIIRGDNLGTLKILRQNYYAKVKMIYIDPPYNTNSGNFIYNDSFKIDERELIEKYEIDEEAIDFLKTCLAQKPIRAGFTPCILDSSWHEIY